MCNILCVCESKVIEYFKDKTRLVECYFALYSSCDSS